MESSGEKNHMQIARFIIVYKMQNILFPTSYSYEDFAALLATKVISPLFLLNNSIELF